MVELPLLPELCLFSGVLSGCSLAKVQRGMVLDADVHSSRCSVGNPHRQSLGRRCAPMEVSNGRQHVSMLCRTSYIAGKSVSLVRRPEPGNEARKSVWQSKLSGALPSADFSPVGVWPS